MNDVSIRDALETDAEAIIEIYRPAIENTPISFELVVPSREEMCHRIAVSDARYPWIVLVEQDAVIGYAYARPFRARAAYHFTAETTVYVHPNRQGAGCGRKLMEHLIDRLVAEGHHLLVAGITLPNRASVALHESLGFQKVGVFPEIGRKFDVWHDVGFWSKRLAG